MSIHQTPLQQQQCSNSASDQTNLSFDNVSNYFSLPLSDAADILGVCGSALKKICHDNGLVRWPYRKFLSGKSIEDIKKDAAREKIKEPAELKATEDRNDDLTSFAVSTVGSPLQKKTTTSVQEISKSRGITNQQGNKNIQNVKPQDLHSSNLTNGTPSIFDEFKYGFPSDGLSTFSNNWWGSSSPDSNEDTHGNESEDIQQYEQQSKGLLDDGSRKDRVESQSGTDESNIAPQPQGTGLMSGLRKRVVNQGREALKLGVYRGYGINKLGRRERVLLLGIFKSSLSRQWRDGSL